MNIICFIRNFSDTLKTRKPTPPARSNGNPEKRGSFDAPAARPSASVSPERPMSTEDRIKQLDKNKVKKFSG